jgi:putative membrane protein
MHPGSWRGEPAGIPLLPFGARADAATEGRTYAQDMMDGYDMNGWGWFGMTMMVIVTVAVVGLVVWAIARRPGDLQTREPSAREQLDARLARGEIDTQEYRERLEALSGHRVGG